MKFILRFALVFLAVTGAAVWVSKFSDIQFGNADYWQLHGFLFMLGLATFPRLTLLFTVSFGGWMAWLAWLFAPRVLVAVLATISYWNQNPFLVVIAWLFALGGESSEKYVMVERTPFRRRSGYKNAKWVDSD